MNLGFYRFSQGVLRFIFVPWNRLSVHGSGQVESRSGVVIAANHVSYLDPPILGAAVKRPVVFLAKAKLFELKFWGTLITWLGAQPVAGGDDFRTLRAVTRRLKSGEAVVIFPEGTRGTGGQPLKPMPGVAFLAHVAGVPVVPCWIGGSEAALPRKARWVRPAKITVKFGPPIFVGDCPEGQNRDIFYELEASRIMEASIALKGLAA